MAFQDDAKVVVIKHAKALAAELGEVAIFPALEKAVKESKSPIDDMVLAALEAPLKDAYKKLIEGL